MEQNIVYSVYTSAFWKEVGLERGPLSLVNTTEELTEWSDMCSREVVCFQ
jgi:hypothetical protein